MLKDLKGLKASVTKVFGFFFPQLNAFVGCKMMSMQTLAL